MRQTVGGWMAALVGLFVIQCAQAGFVVETPAASSPTPATTAVTLHPSVTRACLPGVVEVGTRPVVRSLLANGTNEDPALSLRRIFPQQQGWVLSGELSSRSPAVTWEGGRPWPDIANSIAQQANLCLTLDWAKHTVVMAPGSAHVTTATVSTPSASPPIKATSPAAMAPVNAKQAAVTVPLSAETTSPVEPTAAPPVTYALKAGESVRTTLTRWCLASGWTLIWSAELDYPVDVSTTLPSTTNLRGAVKEVLRAYWNQPYALEGHVYSNQVIEIVGRTH